jgi:hypothetical protein
MRHDAATALRLDDEELPSLESVRNAHLESVQRSRQGRRFERSPRSDAAGAVALEGRPDVEPERPRTPPRSTPGRAYGSHRRGDVPVAAGYQPGRRTVAITGQVQQPRRRSQTTAAFMARPDRTALWAFLLAVFLVLMAVATANAAV